MALGHTITQVTDSGIKPGIHFPSFYSSGIATATNFKTGTSNVHNVGLEVAHINVLGADTPIGTGSTIYDDGGARFSGIVTATKFVGDGSDLEGVASAGLGTGLSDDQTNTLNKIYYSDDVLLVGSTITINPPPSTSNTYTQYLDIKVDTGADLIVNSGSFIPYVLNLANWDE